MAEQRVEISDHDTVIIFHDASGKEFMRLSIATSAIPHSDQQNLREVVLSSLAHIMVGESCHCELSEKNGAKELLRIHLFPKHLVDTA